MKRVMLTVFVIIAFSSVLKADEIFYDITFSSPEHTVGQVPVTGSSPTRPSRINFGSPIVSSSLGLLQDQPLVFNSAGNSPSFYYDQIKLDMDRGRGFYYTSFDVLTHNFIGSRNKFTLLYDMPSVHNISFRNTGMINLFYRKDIPFQDDIPMHFEILMDLSNDYAIIFIDGQLVYDDELLLYRNRYDPEDYYLRSLRFNHGLQSGTGGPDVSSSIALDNIIVADHIVSQPCNPVADAGENQWVSVDENCIAAVTLDGLGSYDPDGLELTYEWLWTIDGELYEAYSVGPTIELPVGEHTIQLIVNNGECNSAPDETVIVVLDGIPPELEVSVEPAVLWPPNHKMVRITPEIFVWDNCSGEQSQVALVSITCNEPDKGQGDGHTSDDIMIDGDGNIYLRAERNGTDNDRVYTITYEAMDAIGNNTQASATVIVPHDKRSGGK